MAYRLIGGITPREETLAAHLFEGFGPETNFLTMPHTRTWYRKEHLLPIVVDRDNYDAWEALGRKSIGDRASDRVRSILGTTPSNLPDPALRAELHRIMAGDARANGVAKLPDLPL